MVYSMIHLFLVVFIILSTSHLCVSENDYFVGIIVNYIKENVPLHKVNLIIDSPGGISPITAELVNEMTHQIPSNIFDSKQLTNKRKVLMESESPGSHLEMYSERLNLAVGIVDLRGGVYPGKKLNTMLESYRSLMFRLVRRKYLLITIRGEEEVDFESSFRYAWSDNFLDLTIIDVTASDSSKPLRHNSANGTLYEAMVHTFNPFFEDYSVTTLDRRSILFPNKVKDLNGYKFRIVAEIDIRFNVFRTGMEPESQVASSGRDFLMCQAFMDALNATMMIAPDENYWNPWYINSTDIGATYNNHTSNSDMRMNMFHEPIVLSKDPKHEIMENLKYITFPTPTAYYLLLKRPVEDKIIDLNLNQAGLAYMILFITGAIFALCAHLLGFKEENWSTLNIMTAQMGGSIEPRGRMKMSEKIYLITMYIVTFMVTDLVTDQMMRIFIYRQEISDFKSLKNLTESNIPLTMNANDHEFLSGFYNTPVLTEILSRIEVVGDYAGFSRLCRNTYHGDQIDQSINLCLWDSKREIIKTESYTEWYIDKIEEPVQVIHPRFYLQYSMFYFDPIKKLITRFSETGITESWDRISRRDRMSLIIVGSGAHPTSMMKNVIPTEKNVEDAMPLKYQLAAVMAVGSILSICVLFCEILWSRYIRRTKLGTLIVAFKFYSQMKKSRNVNRKDHPEKQILRNLK
ncbi:hypothetical protein QAD02_016766 [Eretmocerus hayati]|uniref:Uncharacterized protein n=1 Tax=Eretmocerus hayati TaxID=131215 RepID=A0ACC2PBI3_9HYME|nr:hypothetical protein QAD02_016766 [Eretmocerus hayati]